MSMESDFCEYLLTKPVITNIIGTGSDARLWPINLPETHSVRNGGAAAVYEIISSVDTHTLSDRSGFVKSRIQIATYATTHTATMELARAIKNCGVTQLKGVSGSTSTNFRSVEVESGIRCFNEQPNDGTDSWRYVAEFDFMISYLEGS